MSAALLPEKSPAAWSLGSVSIFLGVATGFCSLTTFLQLHNLRILTSWHGFLHTAIANRFPGPFATPENPFFAGEPLPYYWFHHYVASAVGRALGTDAIHAFQFMTCVGLAILWIGAGAIGIRHFKSVRAGLLVGFLALAGVNPLGPAIALGKNLLQGQALIGGSPPPEELDAVFSTNRQADALMTQPLLGSLYFSGDWRRGQNVTWFVDSSSRGVAVALILPFLCAFMGGTWSWARFLSIGVIAAAMTAFNPLIGLAAVGSVLGGAVTIAAFQRIRGRSSVSALPTLGLAVAGFLGAAAASPTYYHLFLLGGSAAGSPGLREILVKAVALAFNIVVLLPLAVIGSFRARRDLRDQCQVLVLAACALLAVVPLISLPDNTEHNLANAAQTLLVLPAVAAVMARRSSRLECLCLVGLFVPMTVASMVSYLGRPSLPIAFENGVLHRTSPEGLEQLYVWIRESTAPRSVFVADAAKPVKMSGNVAELPAFTGRALFVDQPNYLTTPHKDFERRLDLTGRLVAGSAMQGTDTEYLTALNRPMYLISYRAGEAELTDGLNRLYGLPLFRKDFIAVYALLPANKHR